MKQKVITLLSPAEASKVQGGGKEVLNKGEVKGMGRVRKVKKTNNLYIQHNYKKAMETNRTKQTKADGKEMLIQVLMIVLVLQ